MPERTTAAVFVVLAGFSAAAAAGEGGQQGAVTQQRASQLERLVRQDCGSCHGMTLKGGLGPDIRAAALAGSDPASIAAIILDGVPGKPMPAWRPLLSEADARWIADYLVKEVRQ